MQLRPIALIRIVAVGLCTISLLLTIANPAANSTAHAHTLLAAVAPSLPDISNVILSFVSPVLIGTGFLIFTLIMTDARRTTALYLILAAQTLLTLTVSPELQFLVAVEAGLWLPTEVGLLWVISQSVAAWLPATLFPSLTRGFVNHDTPPFLRLMAMTLLMLGIALYNFFAYALGRMVSESHRHAAQLSIVNAELMRTTEQFHSAQKAASHAARLEERLSIARELHDSLGHQLTTLSVNLQVANRLSKDEASPAVHDAYSITGNLLQDLRGVVSTLREPVTIDFIDSLRIFSAKIEHPIVHLRLAPLPTELAAVASHNLFRCVQELITNSIRHASACNIWIDGMAKSDAYEIRVHDDGKGRELLFPGNGLVGIRERMEEMNGNVRFETRPNEGFTAMLTLLSEPESR